MDGEITAISRPEHNVCSCGLLHELHLPFETSSPIAPSSQTGSGDSPHNACLDQDDLYIDEDMIPKRELSIAGSSGSDGDSAHDWHDLPFFQEMHSTIICIPRYLYHLHHLNRNLTRGTVNAEQNNLLSVTAEASRSFHFLPDLISDESNKLPPIQNPSQYHSSRATETHSDGKQPKLLQSPYDSAEGLTHLCNTSLKTLDLMWKTAKAEFCEMDDERSEELVLNLTSEVPDKLLSELASADMNVVEYYLMTRSAQMING